MSITGLPGQGPVRVGIPIADLTRRPVLPRSAFWSRCLSARNRGKGQHVTTSLLQAQIFMLDFQGARWLIKRRGAAAGRQQSSDQHPDRRVQDRRRPHQHRHRPARRSGSGFCNALERAGADASGRNIETRAPRARRTATRSTPRSTSYTAKRTSADWVERFNKAGVPCGPIYSIDQVYRRSAGRASRHRAAGEDARTRRRSRMAGQPMALSRTPSGWSRRRRRSASTPTRCSRNSASAPRRSPRLRKANAV